MRNLPRGIALILAFLILCPAIPGWAEEEGRGTGVSSYALDNPNLLRKTSLDLRDINVADAVRYLADKAEMNVAIGKNVAGKVTLSLKNVTIRDALDIILLSNDLAVELRGEILYVMLSPEYEQLHGEKWSDPRQAKIFKLEYARAVDVVTVLNTLKSKVGSVISDNESGTIAIMDTPEKIAQMREAISSMDKEQVTQVFELKYAAAKEVEGILVNRLDAKGIGTIKADVRYNQVVVTALPRKMVEIENIIAELDKKTRQVLIEAKIVKVTLNPDFEMGINWEYLMHEGQKNAISMGDFVMNFPVSAAVTSFGKFNIMATNLPNQDSYDATLTLLKTVGDTKLLSSPRITAINNQEAKILVGTREAYVTNTVTQGQTTTTTAENVTFLDVGVQLTVLPIINEDGYVTMKIKPEVSSVARYLTTSDKNQIPIVDTTTAETTVMVKDGTTIIIGGLIKDETVRTTKKVPLLGDIPLLGIAFRQVKEEKEKTELVVFLTPHIVTGDKDMPAWEDKQIKDIRDYRQ
jgi:MSHA type pilus biogenesis protein MshL